MTDAPAPRKKDLSRAFARRTPAGEDMLRVTRDSKTGLHSLIPMREITRLDDLGDGQSAIVLRDHSFIRLSLPLDALAARLADIDPQTRSVDLTKESFFDVPDPVHRIDVTVTATNDEATIAPQRLTFRVRREQIMKVDTGTFAPRGNKQGTHTFIHSDMILSGQTFHAETAIEFHALSRLLLEAMDRGIDKVDLTAGLHGPRMVKSSPDVGW